MTLSEMRQLLDREGIRLTRSLGQNFLHDGNQLTRIVVAAQLEPGDQVLEIGPGLGALTDYLVRRPLKVLAIEVDRRLFEVLRQRLGGCPNLTLVLADALEYLRTEPRDWRPWKLVSNLPYSVASPILVELALNPRGPRLMTVTLQWEVAQRLLARPGSPDYGVLTLLIQLDYEAQDWFKIPAACFFPVPEVDSACITLVRRSTPLLEECYRQAFVRLVKQGFSQRRKMLRKLLKAIRPEDEVDAALAALGLLPTVRGEELSLEQWVGLTRLLGVAHV
ncbi:16S rRNA (adenine(1518)-N(6)/adenine(1519)-N(6))-dimethyltransferase RsmA [Fontisphaera persica]|uniref:16S rRNA (adenine(1518)-N(6)/adenine(1519)-N(6))- dimethyltransferase RsmA n=1 Tax=Fontisphaera persica TaxID=2974023 RepID=UPI0024BF5352|nr:16S rRNA (adenine(1518)-N(6)/adenine(1519)-N(6))-dimethyltransferase RsmA [Fontisphaera persica]WCJ60742.1 16S rRNA (adenine(1518)-N(6)/adenine(1519)-N(6))-dimethyltransferase RsmA [Fontisphaera persica]